MSITQTQKIKLVVLLRDLGLPVKEALLCLELIGIPVQIIHSQREMVKWLKSI